MARLSQLFHREPADGDGRRSGGREGDGGFVCVTGMVVAAILLLAHRLFPQ
jgi:hypothetical protein